MLPTDGTNKSMLLMLPLLLLMTACAPQSTLSAIVCPVLPPVPLLTQSLPQVPYSETAQQNTSAWQKKLTDTQTMLNDSKKVGPTTPK